MRRTLMMSAVVLLCGVVFAQELRVTRMRMMPAGKSPDGQDTVTMVTDAGETVSKNGVVVPYELFLAGEKPGGFRFERAPLMSLQAGDQIRMYVTGLEPEPLGGDPTSEAGGIWKLVTVAGLKESGGRLHFEFQEKLKRKDGSLTQEVVLTVEDKYLVSASAESDAAAPATAAAPGRSWSVADVPLWGWVALLAVALVGMLVALRLGRKPSANNTAAGS